MLPSPVERLELAGGRELWIKRDDLNAPVMGGNKVRSLEFLLGGIGEGDTMLTVGGTGSTHVLATAVHARRLGANTEAFRWTHEMNDIARLIAAEATQHASTHEASIPGAFFRAWLRSRRGPVRRVPFGGSSPLGILGHVNAGLELAGQIERGELPAPGKVVVPVGSGGTIAGLALGFAIAGLPVQLVGARAGPRLGVRIGRIMALHDATRGLIGRETGTLPRGAERSRITLDHSVYGGAYGRPLATGTQVATLMQQAIGVHLDPTYSAKACALALRLAVTSAHSTQPTLFWITFDGRWMRRWMK